MDSEFGQCVQLKLFETHIGVPSLCKVGQLKVRVLVYRLVVLPTSRHFHFFWEIRLHEERKLVSRYAWSPHASCPNLVRRGLEDASSMNLHSLTNLECNAVLRNADLYHVPISRHGVEPGLRVFWERYL